MNTVILMGRLTRDPEIRHTENTTIARYSLAVDRRYKRDGEQEADFFVCKAFGKCAEFAEKYLKQGTKIAIRGRLQSGSYTDREGRKVYTTDVIVDEQEFAESKKSSESRPAQTTQSTDDRPVRAAQKPDSDGFMQIPDDIDEELPFN